MKTLYAIAPLAIVLSLIGPHEEATQVAKAQPSAHGASRMPANRPPMTWGSPVLVGTQTGMDRLATVPLGPVREARLGP